MSYLIGGMLIGLGAHVIYRAYQTDTALKESDENWTEVTDNV